MNQRWNRRAGLALVLVAIMMVSLAQLGQVADAQEATPGTAVILHAGDTAIADFTLPTTYTNAGTTPVQMVSAGLYAGTLLGSWGDVEEIDRNEEIPSPPRPAGPADVRLVGVTLPPGGEVPAPPPGSLVLEVGATRDASIGKRADGSLRNLSDHAESIYVLTIAPVPTATATPTS